MFPEIRQLVLFLPQLIPLANHFVLFASLLFLGNCVAQLCYIQFSLLLLLCLRNDLIASYLLPFLVVTALACIIFLPYRGASWLFYNLFCLYLRFLLLYLLSHNAQYQHESSQQIQNITKPNLTWNGYCHSLSFWWKIRASISLLVQVSGEYFSFQTLLSFMC